MTKELTITFETNSLLILHSRNSRRAWCPVCGLEAEVIEVEPRAVSDSQASALDQLLNCQDVHRVEAPGGSVLICLTSLLHRVQDNKPASRGTPRLPNSHTQEKP